MKTVKAFEIEITRNNVTPAQFLAYLRRMQKSHPEMSNDFDLHEFRSEGWSCCYRNALPEERPCASEIVTDKPYEKQTYVLNHDGSCYNEIIEFQFNDDVHGYGYYYTVQIDVEDEDVEANRAEMIQNIKARKLKKAERIEREVKRIRDYVERDGHWLSEYYVKTQTDYADVKEREARELRKLCEETETETETERKDTENMSSANYETVKAIALELDKLSVTMIDFIRQQFMPYNDYKRLECINYENHPQH